MPGKERGDARTPPDRAGHSAQNQKEQERIANVQQDIRQVMPGGLQAVDLAIQHVRKPGQWVPVARMVAKRPNQAVAGQAPLHLRILNDPDFIAGRLHTGFMERYLTEKKTSGGRLAEAV